MLALALLAAHMLGDFVFQTRWQAARKLDDFAFRVRHVTVYSFAFVPVAALSGAPLARAALFLVALFLLHLGTDSRRFRSTVGDVLVWHGDPELGARWSGGLYPRAEWNPEPCPPNPWPALPLMIDQTLHVVQLAALGWLLT